MKKTAANPHRGSSFESFLHEEGMYEEVATRAAKKVQAWRQAQEHEDLKKQNGEINLP